MSVARRALIRWASEPLGTLQFAWRTCRGEYAPAPHWLKMRILKRYLPRRPPVVLVETGTLFGDTVEAMRPVCERVLSIELDAELYRAACRRFAGAPNVEVIAGDCVEELPGILERLERPAAFWLDGHYSGGVTARGGMDDPILISLEQIRRHPIRSHLLFVDDARCFDGQAGHPRLLEVLTAILAINADYRVRIHNDVMVASAPEAVVAP